ncbi:uncharacterized protein N7498_009982 [Penicillium cinerascens]|uniref:Uncharacterized protein n=1 Tax=Penicillium cinerascens TaxID=70096 RepID=A0A9W9J6W3_9EURO|nr:uncharacterized protein N7498_009982 [Penicillium cinerascens]KAJ5190997.1 hypothetical protein N7498_009982 [Penicillium cinerascens]
MGLFSDSSSNNTCPTPTNFATEASKPIVGTISFYRLNMMASGACTGLVCLIMFGLMFYHATHLSKPREQIKIMKICMLLPLYTITSFVSVCFPKADVYLEPWLEVFQAIALASFFLLLCEFIASDNQTEVDVFFAAFEAPKKKNGERMHGLEWFRKQWIAIFQYPVVAILVAIATDITQGAGIYCLDSNKPHFAHIWLTVVSSLSVSAAVMSVLNFYKALSTHLKGHQPLAKLLAFKLIVGLSFVERIIFTILRSTNTLKPTSTLSYGDTNIGIPNLLICLQMVLFALFFPYAYRVSPYINGGPYKGGSLGGRAWIGMLSPMEILRAIKFACNMAQSRRTKKSADYSNIELGPSYEAQAPPYGYPQAGPIPSHDRLLDRRPGGFM